MDSGDPTALLLTKIKSLEPDHASKIIGYLLFHDFGESDLMNLALGSDSILQSIISKVKTHLGLSSNTLSAPSTSPLNHISRKPINGRGAGSSYTNGFLDLHRKSLSSSSSSTSPWSLNNGNKACRASMSEPLNGVSGSDACVDDCDTSDLLDEQQLNDYLSFLNDSCSKPEDYFVNNGETHLHRRSFSADASFVLREDGFGDGNGAVADSPRKVENFAMQQQEEMMMLKMAYQKQRMTSQRFGRAPEFPYEKRMELLLHHHAHRHGALPFVDERYWSSSPGRLKRMGLMAMHFGDQSNAASRQIYLTFPADSTFKDEDVATYFSLFGTVQDVRIPYQQKRMFGFVSFAHPDTVEAVLARGNPHFICDSRILVKPYKEKGKVLDRKQQHMLQQMIERENYSLCSSPSGIDPIEQSDFGSKMLYERREMMRRGTEQAGLQRAIELERRRFINLQLPDFHNSVAPNHHRSLSVGSPCYFSSPINKTPDFKSELTGAETPQADDTLRSINSNYSNNAKEGTNKIDVLEPDTGRSYVELVLPSNLLTSATSTNDSAETNVEAGVSSARL
ncbi:unnamed protein product [Cochlearia groenlandica]